MFSYEPDNLNCKWTDWRKAPLSKCPIEVRIHRAINEGRSFSNPSSLVATSLRWEKNCWILSMHLAIYNMGDPSMQSSAEYDIAIGMMGKAPFMFRSPYVGDPTKGIIPSWEPDKDGNGYQLEWVKADKPSECYSSWFKCQAIVSRLSDIGIFVEGRRTVIGSKLNEKTGRQNKIYATVPSVWVMPKLAYADRSIDNDIGDYPPEHIGGSYLPMLKQGWYDPAGNLLIETGEPTAKL
jgi:hypothetical protein